MAQRSLQQFVEEVSGKSHLRIEYDYGDGFVRLHASEAERRQAAQDIRSSEDIIIELLRNSRDAHATHVFAAMARSGNKRTLTVIDDGDGIPSTMHERIFEPRVTSKLDTYHTDKWGLHGRGMALFSVSENAESAAVIASVPLRGSSIQVVTDVSKLPEKADQSSFPTFSMTEDGTVNVRGPKNLLRTVCEFALEERASCSVHLGSPTEILASIYAYGLASMLPVDRLFCKDASDLPLVKLLAIAADPSEFACSARKLGFEISERSARRIMDGEIPPATNILERISIEPASKGRARVSQRQNASHRVKFSRDDLQSLSDAASTAFRDLADKYYLESDVEPSIRTSADRLTISLPIIPH